MGKCFKDIPIGGCFVFKKNIYMKCQTLTTSLGNDIYIANAICLRHNNPKTYGKVGEFVHIDGITVIEPVDDLNLISENENDNLKFKHLKNGECFIMLGHKEPGEEFLYEKIEIMGRPENTLNLITMTIFQTLEDTDVIRYDD